MIGIGFHLNDAIRVITFVVVLIMKIKKSENQNEETKKTLKIVGSVIFLLIGTFGLVKLLNWIGDYAILGKQIYGRIVLFWNCCTNYYNQKES